MRLVRENFNIKFWHSVKYNWNLHFIFIFPYYRVSGKEYNFSHAILRKILIKAFKISKLEMKTTQLTLQELWNKGHRTASSLMELTGYPRATMFRTLKKLREGVSLEIKKGSGRKPLLDANDRRRLLQLARHNDTSSSSDLAAEMVKRGSPAVSSRSIRRYLNEAGYFSMVQKKYQN